MLDMPKMKNLVYINVPVVQLSRNLACMLLKIIKILYTGHAKNEEPWVYTCSCGHNELKLELTKAIKTHSDLKFVESPVSLCWRCQK